MKDHPARIADLVTQAEGMAALILRVKQLNVLNQWLQHRLPPAMRQHARVVNLTGDTLVLAVDNAAWAARLRCLCPELLQPLRDECGVTCIRDLHVRVAIPQKNIESRRLPRPEISADNAAHLRSLADSTDDPAMRSVLLRLSSRA